MEKEIILPDVSQDIRTALEKTIRLYPVSSNRATVLGHPCTRFLVYNRLDWDKAPMIDVVRLMIFRGGKVLEQSIAKPYLEEAGYQIVEQNRPLNWKEKEIGAILDFIIKKDNLPVEVPVECKSMNQYDWKKLDSIEDLLFSKKLWHRLYPGQLTVYMLQKGVEYGLFLLINKLTYEPKHIWVHLDYTYAEELIKKAEYVNRCTRDKTYPDRMQYDSRICDRCDYAHICLPDIDHGTPVFIDSEEWEDKLSRYLALKPLKSEYDGLDKEIAKTFKEQTVTVGTRFKITGAFRERTAYEVPDDIKQGYKTTKKSWVKKVFDLERKGAADGTKANDKP